MSENLSQLNVIILQYTHLSVFLPSLSPGMVPTNMVRVNIFVSSISGLPADEITIGELAQEKGYKTALIG